MPLAGAGYRRVEIIISNYDVRQVETAWLSRVDDHEADVRGAGDRDFSLTIDGYDGVFANGRRAARTTGARCRVAAKAKHGIGARGADAEEGNRLSAAIRQTKACRR